ncbi:MAG: hypothetical protein ACJ74W_15570 [Pyrinomonadaceae bacterium]
MHHLKIVEPPSSSIQQSDITFEQWLASFGKNVKASWGVYILSTVATTLHPTLSQLIPYNPQWILPVVCGIQFTLIVFMILWSTLIRVRTFSPPDESSDEAKARESAVRDECGYSDPVEWANAKNAAQTGLSHYRTIWMFFLLSLLLLYLLLFFSYMPSMTNINVSHVLNISVTFVNNCVSLLLLFGYFTLDYSNALSGQGKQSGVEKYWALWVTTLILLTAVEAGCMAVVWHNQIAGFNPENISTVFEHISGIGAAVAMGFYISRLASKFLACPVWVRALLAIYAAIQPLFHVFGVRNLWGTIIITNLALLLKGLLCLYMMFLFEHGRLLFYFVRVRRLGELLNPQMTRFSSILVK